MFQTQRFMFETDLWYYVKGNNNIFQEKNILSSFVFNKNSIFEKFNLIFSRVEWMLYRWRRKKKIDKGGLR